MKLRWNIKLKLNKKLNKFQIQMKYKFKWIHDEIFFLDEFFIKMFNY
jgi:hypothetical protein